MNDRELLELAAKAAGVFLTPKTLADVFPKWKWEAFDEPKHIEGGGMSGMVVCYTSCGEPNGTTREEWNPLTDDGDALRLAVKLHLWEAVRLAHREVSDTVDIYAATRRAIVRAAAKIGKVLK